MNNKVIEVLDYMGQKLGIAIDWTADNVMPQVMDFLARYRVYGIASSSAWLLVCLVTIFASVYILKVIVKQRKEKDGIFWYEDEFMVIVAVVSVLALVVCTVFIIANIFSIITWIVIPEMKFIEVFSQYLK